MTTELGWGGEGGAIRLKHCLRVIMVGGEPMKRNTLRCFECADCGRKKDASEPITDFKSIHPPSVILTLPRLIMIFLVGFHLCFFF